MISRRAIRIKVMQTLYSLEAEGTGNSAAGIRPGTQLLNENLERTLDYFTLALLYTARVAQYAEIDATQRRSKRLPTPEDLTVSTKVAGNEALWRLLEDATFQQRVKDRKLGSTDDEAVRKLYNAMAGQPFYTAYIAEQSREPKKERATFATIWREVLADSEVFTSVLEEKVPDWEDDRVQVGQMMDAYFRAPQKVNFLLLLSAEKREYAHELLKAALEREEFAMSLIQPKLQNWDPERVALIDMLLLRMGVCELLYFPTIPTKVTINEYIDIAKTYSTTQSGQFVNGVLDNVLKDLEREGKIRKTDRAGKS